MSIAYFPELYPDELVYSVLSRAYMHGGYKCVHHAEEEFFVNPKIRIEKEFIKNLKPEIVSLLTRGTSFDEVIEKHTMYPLYGRFIDKERRDIALTALEKMEGDFSKLFRVPNLAKDEQRYFRFCPLCAYEDRKKYSETYWHRKHQIRGIFVCCEHGCYLHESTVSLNSRISVKLITAEEVVPENNEIILCQNQVELGVANYVETVFELPIIRENNGMVGNFLHFRMANTEYLSSRGERVYIHKLWSDMKSFYQGISEIENLTVGQIQDILRGKRVVFIEICMLAMFLDISPEELVEMNTPAESLEQQFDKKVLELLESGMSMKQIAKDVGVSLSIISKVKEIARKEKTVKLNRPQNAISFDWEKMDNEALPLVKKAICDMFDESFERPKKISIYSVSEKCKIPMSHLQRMQKCRQEIDKNREKVEKYNARKVKWALNVLMEQEKPTKMWRICAVSKLEKEEIKNCMQDLKEIISPELLVLVENEVF